MGYTQMPREVARDAGLEIAHVHMVCRAGSEEDLQNAEVAENVRARRTNSFGCGRM
jgi:hypothetical protein